MKNSTLEVAVVFKPTTGEIFSAIRGEGAFYNGERIQPLGAINFSESLIGSGFPYRSQDYRQAFFSTCNSVLDETLGIRRYGSAALDLAYTAIGSFQGFWESDLEPYDVAAGLLILKEAGGMYQSVGNKSYDMFSDRILISGWKGTIEPLSKIVNTHYS